MIEVFSLVNQLHLFVLMLDLLSVYGKTYDGKEGDDEIHVIILVGVLIAMVIAIFFLAYVCLSCVARKKSQRLESVSSSPPLPQTTDVTIVNDIGVPLTYEAIVNATGNFNIRNRIGFGGFGSTYKAEVSPGNIVAVKKLTASTHQGVPQFDAEVNMLRRLSHPNLITLIGYYAFKEEMFLIYNYLSGGNLNHLISGRGRQPLNWTVLHKISLHVASALSFLHEVCNPCIIHRDIKPSNILLDDDCNAYLADFGLSKMLNTGDTHVVTRVAGTYGYVDPEYASTGHVSNKSDVYSYGVVLLELMSDKQVLDPSFSLHETGFNIVSWARELLQNHRPHEFFRASLWDSVLKNKLVRMLNVAVLCTAELPSARPQMKVVVRQLEQLQLPTR